MPNIFVSRDNAVFLLSCRHFNIHSQMTSLTSHYDSFISNMTHHTNQSNVTKGLQRRCCYEVSQLIRFIVFIIFIIIIIIVIIIIIIIIIVIFIIFIIR